MNASFYSGKWKSYDKELSDAVIVAMKAQPLFASSNGKPLYRAMDYSKKDPTLLAHLKGATESTPYQLLEKGYMSTSKEHFLEQGELKIDAMGNFVKGNNYDFSCRPQWMIITAFQSGCDLTATGVYKQQREKEWEQEVVFAPGTQFDVYKYEQKENGKDVFYMREVAKSPCLD